MTDILQFKNKAEFRSPNIRRVVVCVISVRTSGMEVERESESEMDTERGAACLQSAVCNSVRALCASQAD